MRDTEIWADKSLTNLLEDIHDGSLSKRKTLLEMIGAMRLMMKDAESTVIIAPIIKEFIDVLVRSDEHLVKVATIVQRILAAETLRGNSGEMSDLLTEEERNKLLGEVHIELIGALDVMESAIVSGSAMALSSGSVSP